MFSKIGSAHFEKFCGTKAGGGARASKGYGAGAPRAVRGCSPSPAIGPIPGLDIPSKNKSAVLPPKKKSKNP